ncbi:hypothetical protein [Xanthovirga aplysinae]|uniref:hypothetical protein n=1 Tax=Xanthovirga aplysinae TaxID=2529853 RepID=UPI0012BD329D|nr:hypothetical protein [Xanthovirga aplysinae]MTI32268.1 hypothetical protein [Xanthovirga aplysinae]
MATNIFPQIFSLTTIGLRNHYNQDYLFHPQRTDFTGDNGVGKSIIADVLQLILVGRSSLWKAGTDGTDENKRQVRTMPLDDKDNPFAYALLNIQREENKFIAIGVYIPTNKSAVRPFVIHRNLENDGTVFNLDHPILSDDIFLHGRIPDHKELKKHFLSKGINFQSFYHSEEVREYHRLLYKNKILPYDLSSDNSLRMFAEVLQSFSRAKTLNINKSKSLKNFLFTKDQSALEHYNSERNRLIEYIEEYNRAEVNRVQLLKKKDALSSLESALDKKEKTFFDWLLCDTALAFQKKEATQVEIKKLEKEENSLTRQLNKLQKEIGKLEESTSKKEKERDDKQNNINLLSQLMGKKAQKEALQTSLEEKSAKLEEVREEVKKCQKRVEELQEELDERNAQLPELVQHEEYWDKERKKLEAQAQAIRPLEELVEKYGDLHKIRFSIQEQQRMVEKKDKLEKLKKLSLFGDFEKSLWATHFDQAEKYYLERITNLPGEIRQHQELISLYEQKNEGSFFEWAINKQESFSKAEEAVIMYFKDIALHEVKAEKGARYLLSPEKILQNLTEKGDGVWLQLGEVREFVPFSKKRLFESPDQLRDLIEEDKVKIQDRLVELEDELQQLQNLKIALNKISFDSAYFELFLERETIESFQIDEDLPSLYEYERMLENAYLYKDRKNIRQNLSEAQKFWSDFFKKRDKTEDLLNHLSREHKQVIEKVADYTEGVIRLEGEHSQQKIHFDELLLNINSLSKELTVQVKEKDYEKSSKSLNQVVEKLKEKIEQEKEKTTEKRLEAGKVDQRKVSLQATLSEKQKVFLYQQKHFEEKSKNFKNHHGSEFKSSMAPSGLNDQKVTEKEFQKEKSGEQYSMEFNKVKIAFQESEKSPEVEANPYDFETLEKILLGNHRVKDLNAITPELDRLNEEMKEIARKQIRFVADVFKDVEREYNKCKRTITQLNAFFSKQSISKDFTVRIEFEADKNLQIGWIEKLRKQANYLNIENEGGLFFNEDVRPEEIIENIAQKYCNLTDLSISTLVDAKNYFDLEVNLLDSEKKKYGGSTGQSYMVLALLCIGRLSIVEEFRDNPREGIRFIIIEELANLDDVNFGIFPKIAKQFGYQLITMTPKPYGSVSAEGWYLHMLTRGTRRIDVNEKPYSVLRKENVFEELKLHFYREKEEMGELQF